MNTHSLKSPLKIQSQIHTPEPLLPERRTFQVNICIGMLKILKTEFSK
jgi:hypothetical protein